MNFLIDYVAANTMLVTIMCVVWYVLLVVGAWSMFEKAGIAGWKAIIPIYNFYLLFRIGWQTTFFWGWLVCSILAGGLSVYSGFAGIFGWVLSIFAAVILALMWYYISVSFGHGLLMFLGLYFFTPLFVMILGLGSSRYSGPAGQAANTI